VPAVVVGDGGCEAGVAPVEDRPEPAAARDRQSRPFDLGPAGARVEAPGAGRREIIQHGNELGLGANDRRQVDSRERVAQRVEPLTQPGHDAGTALDRHDVDRPPLRDRQGAGEGLPVEQIVDETIGQPLDVVADLTGFQLGFGALDVVRPDVG